MLVQCTEETVDLVHEEIESQQNSTENVSVVRWEVQKVIALKESSFVA